VRASAMKCHATAITVPTLRGIIQSLKGLMNWMNIIHIIPPRKPTYSSGPFTTAKATGKSRKDAATVASHRWTKFIAGSSA
jgi:hypothetical protein